MELWCRTHVTDHSGWNHRQHTLNELTKRYQDSDDVNNSLENLILAEFKFVTDVMAPYPTHEALWCHRRYVVRRLLNQASRGAISSALSSVLELISRVAGTLLDPKPESIEAAALSSLWDETFKTLRSEGVEWPSVLRAILSEIEIGWKCGNQFSRRYAAWCLARLHVFLSGRQAVGEKAQDDALRHGLGSLASRLQKHLVQEDNVLEDLWRRAIK